MNRLVSYPRRLADLAAAAPERPAVTCDGVTLTRIELERRAGRLARELSAGGVSVGDMVTIALPNSIEWIVTLVATWKLGAIPQPVNPRLPDRDLEAIVALADPAAIVGVERTRLPSPTSSRLCLAPGHESMGGAEHERTKEAFAAPDVVSPAWKAPTSGGSSGHPKLIISTEPARLDLDARIQWGLGRDGCVVVPGPLYHNGPLMFVAPALLWGHHLVLLSRFDPEATLAAIETHRGEVVYLVPTMMRRIWRLGPEVRDRHDLSSLRMVWHMAEPCPDWLKQAWIDWLGPERIMELYGGTEGQAATAIRGTEWLTHRGSVGRPILGEVMICDESGTEVPPGVHGEVWMRPSGGSTYRYVGAEARRRSGGWESIGDMGYLDDDGFLYLGDRMQDMVLVGGANVYPAEVEAVLQEHPEVESCAVIGLPDDDRGNTVHAIVEADPVRVSEQELLTFAAGRLVAYKRPRSVELVSESLRDEAGKVRRAALRAARLKEAGE